MRNDSYNNYIANEMRNQQMGGNVNLFRRPQIDASLLNEKGWDAGDGMATVYSSTYGNSAGNSYGNFTPIVADKNGAYLKALSEPELTQYAEGVMNGAPDIMGLQIGPRYGSVDDAVSHAEYVHQLQEAYYNAMLRDMYAK